MEWDVEYTDEFSEWWEGLSEAEQEDVAATVELLEEKGPQLPHPYSSGIKAPGIRICGSFESSMQEGYTGYFMPSIHAGWPFC